MKDFLVKCFVSGGGEQNICLSTFDEKLKKQWSIELEEKALSEYYQKKIKVKEKI